MKTIPVLLALLLGFGLQARQDCLIRLSGIRSQEGKIVISVFDGQESFEAERACKQYIIDKDKMRHGRLTARINLPEGVYGIVILDDEDEDVEMTYNALGLPKEGFGFSGYTQRGLRKPCFSDFCFRLEGQTKCVNIELSYF